MSVRPPDAIEPLELWRAWRWDGGRLFSVYTDDEWGPGEPYEAACVNAEHHVSRYDAPPEDDEVESVVPNEACTCGIYALYDPRGLPEEAEVYGKVSVWGKVIRAKSGARAQYAYPSELHIPEWLEDQEALRAYGVPIIVEASPTAPPEPEPDPGPPPSSLLQTPTLEELGISEDMRERISQFLGRPNGAFLVTGPADSGTSTTLFSCLSLATALRSDRHLMVVGEIRYAETARMSIFAANSGHYVLATMPTNDAPSALTRLNGMGVDRSLTSTAVTGILAQRLVRKLCQHCAEMDTPTAADLVTARLSPDAIAQNDSMMFYRHKGCPRCGYTGYKGRVGIYQLLEMNEDLGSLLVCGATKEDIERAAQATGMRNLWDDGIAKVKAGLTDFEELMRVAA